MRGDSEVLSLPSQLEGPGHSITTHSMSGAMLDPKFL